jgi:S1-C subfamily serine protease
VAAEALGNDIESGALITGIQANSAAEFAGLKVGDIILEVNDKKINGAAQLRNQIGLLRSGETIKIGYMRDNDLYSTKAELGQKKNQFILGEEIHPGLKGSTFLLTSGAVNNGIEISEVQENSPAAQRGLRAGDLITQVNRTPVDNLEDLQNIASRFDILFLNIRRGDRVLMFQIR